MGGDIHVDSALGRGSSFSFTLSFPLPADTPAIARGQPLRALVVDDHPEARRVLGELAESLGWQVQLAASGDEALRQAQPGAVDLVLLDWVMPGLDGWQTKWFDSTSE